MQSGLARAAVFAACCDCVNLLTMSGVLDPHLTPRGAFSSSLTTHGIQPSQHEVVWSLPPQGDSKGPHNLHQLHSTAITWTHLHNPGSSVRGTLTFTIFASDPS